MLKEGGAGYMIGQTAWMTTDVARGRQVRERRAIMLNGSSMGTFVLKAALLIATLVTAMGLATAAEEGKYPDLRGQWTGILRSRPGIAGQASFDPGKPGGK